VEHSRNELRKRFCIVIPHNASLFFRRWVMKDVDKDRKRLIDELEGLRQRIAELEASDAERSEAEENYRLLIENAAEAISVAQDGKIKFANPKLTELTGYTIEELNSASPVEVVHPDDRSMVMDYHARRLKGESLPQAYTFRIIDKGGNIKWLERNVSLITWEGKPAAVVFDTDITERKRLEEHVEEERQDFRLIVDSSPVIVFYKDEDGRFMRVNKAFAEALRIRKEEFIGKTVFDFYSAEIAQAMTNDDQEVLKSGRPKINIIEKYESASGIRWARTDKVPILDKDGIPVGLVGFAQDITEWKKTQEALLESEAKYRELAESITDVFFALDNKLRYTHWNKASEELTGISAKDALGKHIYDIFPDTEDTIRAVSAYRRTLATREPQHFVNKYSLGGRDYVFDINTYPTKDGLCVYVKNVTEQRKLEEALDESEQWYHHLFDNAPFGIGFASIDGKVINMNKAMEVITGYSIEHFNKVNLFDTYVNKTDRGALLQEIRRHGSVVDYPVQLRRKDGTPYDALLSIRLTTIGDKEFLQTICQDITERKRAEEALKESEERYRTLVELSPEAIFVAVEGKHVFVNSAGLKLFGASSPDQIMGKPVMDVIHPDYREIVAERMRKAMETWIAPPLLEEKFIRLDGTEIDVEVRGSPLFYQGKPAMQVVVRDISERKRAEEALRLSERNFRESMENSPLGIRIVSKDGRTLYANRTLLGTYGYSSLEELEAVPRKRRYTPESYAEHRERIKKRQRGESVPLNYEISIVRKGGQVRHLAVSRGEVLWNGERQFQVLYQDITERKLVETELRMKDYAIVSSISGILIVDLAGVVIYANQAYLDMWRYQNRERSIGQNLTEVSANNELATMLLNTVRTEGYWKGEIIAILRDGKTGYFMLSASLVKDENGVPIAIMASTIDITERRQAEEALRESEERYRTILDQTGDGYFETDIAGKFTLVNDAMCSLMGYSREELVGMHYKVYTPEENFQKVFEAYDRVYRTGEPLRNFRYDVIRKDGSLELTETSVFPIRNGKGEIAGFRGVRHDITERKRAEEALRESEGRYRLLAENVRDVIWAMDMDLRFTYLSPSIKYLDDRTVEEVMSMPLEQLFTPSSLELILKTFAEELAIADVTALDPNRSRTLEVEILRRDGSSIWAELRMNFMRDQFGHPRGIVGVMRDISERKKAEEEKKEMEQRAQLASRLASVGELSAGIAHEINNPLTGVIGYSELLMQEDVPEHIKRDLEVINDGAKRVAGIVKGLLTFARQSRPERTVVDINQIVEVVLRLRAYELETSNIKVTARLAPDLPVTVADAGQLQQVFLNLIINAEAEMRSAHGRGKLTIKTERLDGKIRISFKDDGPGIAEENRERIFDPFFTTRETGKGTGLGLSICHGIVTEHKGRIYVESQLGRGATFIVELPIVTEKKRPRQAKPAGKPEKVIGGKILVVDDEPVVRQLLSQVLTEDGHEVETTDDGKDALNRIKGNKYNLILLDMKLPGISGSELYECILKSDESLAHSVVFITGDVMGTDTEVFLNRTGVPYLTKPFDVKKLGVEIRRLLALNRSKPAHKVENKKPKAKSKI